MVLNWDILGVIVLITAVLAGLLVAVLLFKIQRMQQTLTHAQQNEEDSVLLNEKMPLAFALHETIRDDQGKIIDYRLLNVNPAFEKLIDQPSSNFLGKTIQELFPKSHEQWCHHLDRVRNGGEVRRSELYLAELDHWYILDSYKLSTDQLVMLIQDVTQNKTDNLARLDSEERLRLCQRHANIGVWQINLRKYRHFRSPFLNSLLGRPQDKRLGWDEFLSAVFTDDRKRLMDVINQEARRYGKLDIDFRILNNEGQIRWLQVKAEVECNHRGKPRKMRGIVQDVTERYHQQARLRLAARVFDDSCESIMITDKDALIIDVNPAFCALTGYSRDEIIGQNPRILSSGRQERAFFAEMWQHLHEQGYWQGELWNRRKDGELFAALLSLTALRDESEHVINYIGSLSNITEAKQKRQMLELLVHYDALTGLPNRSLFADRFKQAIAHSNRSETLLAICYLDLDGFKHVNDNFGHAVGDELLIEVGKRIQLNLRAGDTVCRLGGDEFALLFENLHSLPQCEDTLSRIHDALSEPFILSGQQVRIAATSGVTVYPLDMDEPDVLLRHADQAMYLAKLAGRNRYRIYDKLCDLPYVVPHQTYNHLDDALLDMQYALETRQFCVHYQPKVNLKTGKVVGAEALLRWQHPERGLLLPNEFLPMVSGSSLEMDLNTWVIRQVFQQMLEWQSSGLELQISVNVSPKYILWPEFVATLEEVIEAYPTLNPNQFELEVLENSDSDDLFSVAEILRHCCNRLGINYALDDFGKGSSSFHQLRHFFVNSVKIDQTFVTEMLDNPDDQAVVESVIGLAKAFRRNVVAEGVESVEHGVLLINLGCDLAQGFAIAHPMPGIDMVDWVGSYRNHPAWESCGKTQLNSWQTQLVILKIQQLHWLKRIRTNLQSPGLSKKQWPGLNPEQSYLGRWLERCRDTGTVEEELLAEFEQTHVRQCKLAQQLFDDYQLGKTQTIASHYAELVDLSRTIDQHLHTCMAVSA